MCGIAGVWRRGGGSSDLRAVCEAMSEALRHRGPDDEGSWTDPEAGIGFGFRRLAIIDLSPGGAQPMVSPSGRFVTVFNGEIYNYRRLRAQLPDPSLLRGQSDTEVLLALIDAAGVEGALQQAIGMFAMALWDRADRSLTLVRDRLGVKPLYYTELDGEIVFASELKAIRRHPRFRGAIDPRAAALYARYGYIPAPFTIYEGVHKLEPGTALRFERSGEVREVFWDAAVTVAHAVAHPFEGSDDEALDAVERLLSDSVSLRMIADVPLGVFLSGGIDSSLVTALMCRNSGVPIKTFTIGFEDAAFDEAPHAAAVASHLGTDHHELYLTARDAMEVIPSLPAFFDEPFSDTSAIPTFLVSKMARPDVTVALSGDGGDELFAGYHRHFLGKQAADRHARVPERLRPLMARALRRLPPEVRERADTPLARLRRSVGNRAVRVASLLAIDPLERQLGELSNAIPFRIVEDDAGGTWFGDRGRWPPLRTPTEMLMFLDLMTYLPDDILTKVDRTSMASSLEVREPLLDHRLVELAWSLPLDMKIRNGEGKWILRRLAERYIPRPLIDREKQGFGLPLGEWLRGPLRDWAEDLLADAAQSPMLASPPVVRGVWKAHLDGADRQSALWPLLMFQSWLKSQTDRHR